MKVLVGLSGGVDSAVAAYLLKQQGHEVTCAFMRNWDAMTNNDILGNPTIQDEVCPQEKDYEDAKKVAEQLDLPLLRVDFVKEYWDYVFSAFIEEYNLGRTPNPDILCNKYIKFSSFLDYALKQGFDAIATGHYARVNHQENQSVMLKGVDNNKDQTYFLCQLSYDALKRTLFPIGNLEKSEVRSIAKDLNLSIATKKDSTGICFIGERNFKEFLKNYVPNSAGDIIDIDTLAFIKKHEGVLYYTIGQRKGLDIGGEGGPWFVVGKNVKTNTLYVASKEDNPWLYSDCCRVNQVNWFGTKPMGEFNVQAKFRYRQKDQSVSIKFIDDTTIQVSYPQKIAAVTPGQEAVFYLGDVCLGGGVIDQVYFQGKSLDARLEEKVNG